MKFVTIAYSTIIYLSSGLLFTESKIYTWVDKNGHSHFSDHAAPGTQEVKLKEVNTLSENKAQNKKEEPVQTPPIKEEQKKAILYQVKITSPENDTAIRANDGNVAINVDITPQAKDKIKLQLYVDGVKSGAAQSETTLTAKNMDRGTHQFQVFLLDEKETLLAKTKIISVHVQKVSILNARPIISPATIKGNTN